jgi:hypothetical protein
MDIKDVKPAMANKTKVKFEGTDYTITACILRLIDRQWQYTVELKDLKAKQCGCSESRES